MRQVRAYIYTFICLLLSAPVLLADGAGKVRTVVIDPGHGGHDPGCVSKDALTTEKALTLDIAEKFAGKIREKYPEVKVILTRDEDRYVTLSGRADIANNAGADLFISIHINAAASGSSANGYSVHCLGQSSREGNDLFGKNLELCQRENSVIKLEADYETRYQGFDPSDPQSYIFFSLLQNSNLNMSLAFAEDVNEAMKEGPVKKSRGVSQDPFWVLWRTAMPAVLIECAFISNPDDLAVLRSESDRDKIAACFLKAFTAYKIRYEGSTAVEAPAAQQPATSAGEPSAEPAKLDSTSNDAALQTAPAERDKPEAPAEPTVIYGTQVIASGTKLAPDNPFFRGYDPVEVPGERDQVCDRNFRGFSRSEEKK